MPDVGRKIRLSLCLWSTVGYECGWSRGSLWRALRIAPVFGFGPGVYDAAITRRVTVTKR